MQDRTTSYSPSEWLPFSGRDNGNVGTTNRINWTGKGERRRLPEVCHTEKPSGKKAGRGRRDRDEPEMAFLPWIRLQLKATHVFGMGDGGRVRFGGHGQLCGRSNRDPVAWLGRGPDRIPAAVDRREARRFQSGSADPVADRVRGRSLGRPQVRAGHRPAFGRGAAWDRRR